MNNSIALPRLKTKRKRRKPMGPWTRFWLCFCVWDVMWTLVCVHTTIDPSTSPPGKAFNLAIGALFVWFLMYRDWPRFVHYWKRDQSD